MIILSLGMILMPLYIAWRVYDLFRRDLKFVRSVGKLKTGEYEAMMRRHKIAIRVHALSVALISILLFLMIGIGAIFAASPFFAVFWGHSIAFQRFYTGAKRKSKQKR